MINQEIARGIYDLGYRRSGRDVYSYPQCAEYLACPMGSPTNWYFSFKEKIRSRISNKHELEISELNYKKYFESVSVRREIYYSAIYVILTLFYFYFLGFFLYSLVIDGNLLKVSEGMKDVPHDTYSLICFYILISIFQYLHYNYIDNDSAVFFNRQNGMVEKTVKGKLIQLPFNEFLPMVVHSSHFPSQYRIRLMLCHCNSDMQIPINSKTRVDSVIAWSYLNHFMDSSRPLPDIPLHEAKRHLDPVTRAYDIKSGRDPYYWRKKKYHELHAMEREATERAFELFGL